MVNNQEDQHRWGAPGSLEMVRRFLNTWDLSLNDRVFVDHLPGLANDPEAWGSTFSGLPTPRPAELRALAALRADLRSLVDEAFDPQILNAWLGKTPVRVHAQADGATPRLELVVASGTRTAGRLLILVLDAIAAGTWHRLKSCPDCRLVFFDSTRNRSKVWCGMYAGPGGRACGSIAKVRRWRARRRSEGG